MATLTILHHPDPRLREVAQPITEFGDALRTLVDDMFETMYAAPGVGLAATQVGIAQRVAVLDCAGPEEEPRRMVMINPEVTLLAQPETMTEGCLSVPEIQDKVPRAPRVKLRAQDVHGQPYELEAQGLLAQCIQHELDHLDGKLYIDYLSAFKRDRITKKLKKAARRSA